ncbi:MAG: hypothetical protein VB024_04440 [Dysgonamonadaceae bacterium]|jgi:protein involved in sex pheromone biosynthesis|nr:hypothetical protein [Dysgonamonadaceae bacterium]MDD3309569.1 hypothetical protein [Dysgonamonadaceae bacterium]MDD3901063.1 hypothetical protein [Dysgonamonadaceae bacterium]MDD4399112.1 hypothetical protein [Dysgonamonadaceae bacterium]MEA5080859.1 hypothetical protein [Dysgonamonadaceae bacterium]
MKKVLLFAVIAATIGLASCNNNKQAQAEQATADSLAAVAYADSVAQAQADSIAALAADTLNAAADSLAAVVE